MHALQQRGPQHWPPGMADGQAVTDPSGAIRSVLHLAQHFLTAGLSQCHKVWQKAHNDNLIQPINLHISDPQELQHKLGRSVQQLMSSASAHLVCKPVLEYVSSDATLPNEAHLLHIARGPRQSSSSWFISLWSRKPAPCC